MNHSPNWLRGICIGRGSFGAVNLAVDKSNGAVFAVKSVKQNSDRFFQALENEIRILKSLSSDYIVGYIGDDVTAEDSNSVAYRNLHMEYMPGGTVADLDKHGVDDEVTVRSYTRCIVSALSYIHTRSIVHCDVKGKNVLIGSVPGSAKLADFGSAVELGGPISGARGSPLWMAPEVVRGEYQGPESDVWSLGCTVIEMLTGKPAWQDRGVDTLFQIGYSDELPKLPAQISEELRDFISKCLRRNRLERWSSDQLLQHPFLSSSCSSSSPEFMDKKWSPRCVFDWSSSNFSDEESSEIESSTVNLSSSSAKRRIGELSSNSAPNWNSDGWELVRDAGATTSSPSITEAEEDELMTTVEEMWPEYSDSGSERTDNREYGGDCKGRLLHNHNDDKSTSDDAQSTRSCWKSRDKDNNYSCVYVSLNKLLLFNSNAIRHIYYKILFLFIFRLISDPVSYHYFLINYLPTFFFLNEDLRS